MKNVHLLPTDAPSRLCISQDTNKLILNWKYLYNSVSKHIYITSPNENINENDYIITKDGRLVEVSCLLSKDLEGASKIILTTDQDLTKNGVQEIPDDFIEWFINNPSCNAVETVLIERIPEGTTFGMHGNDEPPTELVKRLVYNENIL